MIRKRMGFSLAGTRCFDMFKGCRLDLPSRQDSCRSELLFRHKKAAFTLAEVLITLVIVGVVAAITIPSLMALIRDKVTTNQQKVFQAKLIQGLNLAKTAGDLANNYTSTEDFVRNGLARHYKMVAICGANNLRDCIPYEEIKYDDGEEEKTIKVADLKTAKSIKVDKQGFEDTAAFISSDGVPVIITYDKTCTVDTEELDKDISSCVAGIYDLNGSKTPNKYAVTLNDDGETIKAYTYDIRTFNGAGVGSTGLFDFEIVVKAFKPIDIYTSVGSPTFVPPNPSNCYPYNTSPCPDYWQAAKTYCENNGASLPSAKQLAKIAAVLYGDNSISTEDEDNYNYINWISTKDVVFEALSLPSNSTYFNLWSNSEFDYWRVKSRGFNYYSTAYNNSNRCSDIHAICVK